MDLIDACWNSIRRCFSVRRNGRVVEHAHDLALIDARFIVNGHGRERVRRNGRKEVHAVIRGTRVGYAPDSGGAVIFYDPYRHETFVAEDGTPILVATNVHLTVTAGRPSVHYWS